MRLSLDEALTTSEALDERIADTKDASVKADLERRKTAVDFTAFGLFKSAAPAPGFLESLGKPLAWGAGLGIPALGVGHLMMRDARHQGEDLIDHARNQALIAAAGLGTANAIKGLMQFDPRQREETEELTLPGEGKVRGRRVVKLSQDALLTKLAAAVLVDNVLEQQYNAADARDKTAIEECLYLNRIHGTSLLKELIR